MNNHYRSLDRLLERTIIIIIIYIVFADRTRTVELVNSILEKALFTLLGLHGHFCFKDGGPGKN